MYWERKRERERENDFWLFEESSPWLKWEALIFNNNNKAVAGVLIIYFTGINKYSQIEKILKKCSWRNSQLLIEILLINKRWSIKFYTN